jgi:hypothetical protein
MSKLPVCLSLRVNVLAMCDERAALFQLTRSRYIAFLIERDYQAGGQSLVITATGKISSTPAEEQKQ